MCSGKAPELDEKTSYIGRWMDMLRPGYDRVAAIKDEDAQLRALEKEAVLISLENLMTFPFVKAAVDEELLTLHGLWTDIGAGGLENYSANEARFVPV